jgi:hypothetical protein
MSRPVLVDLFVEDHAHEEFIGPLVGRMAAEEGLQRVVGARPSLGRRKCARDHYKGVLREAVRQAGHPATLGGIEFAREIVAGVDWYRAGRNDRSLKAFLDALRAGFVRLKHPAARPFARPERR